MPKLKDELGPLAVSRIVKVGGHFVGGVPGLLLLVKPSGAKAWVLRAMVGGKRRNMGLGGYPGVTLAGAREAARAARAMIDQGYDPIAHRKALKRALRDATLPVIVAPVMTFAMSAIAYVAAHEKGWSDNHRNQWVRSLEIHADPVIGKLDVAQVGTEDVLRVLQPIWITKTVTAGHVRSRIEDVLDWARVKGFRVGDNPARWNGHLENLLVSKSKIHKVVHRTALPVEDIPAFIKKLRAIGTMQAYALEFLILCASRPDEVRGCMFIEIDAARSRWIIPPERMKMDREHRVPLSSRALEIVKLQPVFVGSPYVFTGARGGMYADNRPGKLLADMGVNAQPHGFRSTFKDWASEKTEYPNELSEMALAHDIPNQTEAAYRRGDLLEKRIALMNDWADYCNGK